MKVSIITVCYNRESTIRDAIESVLAQDYGDIEYIIVDGASTDGTMDVVNEYRDRIAWIVSEKDSGMYEAINKGIRMATGDVIGILNSDDFFMDTRVISRVVAKIREDEADFLYASGVFVDNKDMHHIVRVWRGGTYRLWKVKNGWMPLHPTCYIRKEIIERLGLYNETYKIAADTDFLLRYLIGGQLNVTYLDRFIIVMRMGGLSTSKRMRYNMWKEDIRVFRTHGLAPQIYKIKKVMWKVPQYIQAKFMKFEDLRDQNKDSD